jgi:CubicO group peptidase (beta-lactamase class C family)
VDVKGLEDAIDGFVAANNPAEIGLTLAVVDRKAPVLMRAYGNRSHEDVPSEAKTSTSFALGSATKPFTSFLAAMAVSEGALSLTAPIRSYIETFAVADPDGTAGMTLEDMLCQRTGVPSHDALWYLTNWNGQDIWDRLRYLDPSSNIGFRYREAFQYNNNLFASAAAVVQQVTEEPWLQALEQRIISPLQMESVRVPSDFMSLGGDIAKPYIAHGANAVPIPFKKVMNISPAAAITASAEGLVPWLLVLTNAGAPPQLGQPLLSKERFDDLITPRLRTNRNLCQEYGLGWFLEQIAGHRLAFHSGNTDGYSAWLGFLPDDGFGLVVLSNQHAFPQQAGMPKPLANRLARLVVHHLLDAPLPDAKEQQPRAQPPQKEVEAADIKGLEGRYVHQAYGEMHVLLENGAPRLRYFDNAWPLQQSADGGFSFELYAFGATWRAQVLFHCDGDTRTLAIPLEPRVGWTRFERAES